MTGHPAPSLSPAVRAVVHLRWTGTAVQVWAERARSAPWRAQETGGAAAPHPGAVAAAEVASALRLQHLRGLRPIEAQLELPARAGDGPGGAPRPVPAPGLGAPDDRPAELIPFLVPALELPREAIPSVLLKETLPAGWYFGGDARYWRQVARLGLELCARGALLPGLATLPGRGVVAAWVPLPGPEEAAALAALGAAMPPACRLHAGAAGVEPQSLFALVVDVCARAGLVSGRTHWSRGLRGERPGGRWLLGLLQPVPMPLGAAPSFLSAVRAWCLAAGVAAAPTPEARLVLRLEDPLPADGPEGPAAAAVCPVSLWLQSFDAAGAPAALLPLPAARAQGGGPGLAAIAVELLRAGCRIFAPLWPALGDASLAELLLPPAEALGLVEKAARRLTAEGTDVVVPSWWQAPPAVPATRLRVEDAPGAVGAPRAGLLSQEAVLAAFRWEVALGGEEMSPESFEALVRSRQSLVRLRTGWVRVDPAALDRVAEGWAESGPRGRIRGFGALRLALEAGGMPGLAAGADTGLPGVSAPPSPRPEETSVVASGAVGRWLEPLRHFRRAEPLAEPSGFVGTLRPYQRAGLGWLAFLAGLGMGGCLADDMGLGKTVQVLALLQHRRAAGEAAGPSLLVCPTSVLGNWQAELGRFTPGLRALVHQGAGRLHGAALLQAVQAADLVLTTYPLLARDGADLAGVAWDGVVLDEAQNVKSPTALQARAARELGARYRFALTGTPVENSLRDLWSIFAFCLPGYLGGGRSFTREYGGPVGGGDEPATARLRRVLGPFMLRRSKRDPAVAPDLPPKIETRQDCSLGPEQAALYAGVMRQSLQNIDAASGLARKAAILTTLLRLKQICNHPSLFLGDGGALQGRSGKLRRLEELLEDVLGEGERALVFTQFATWARWLAPYLQERFGHPAYCLTGAVPVAARPALIRSFEDSDEPAVFVLSLKAGGTGLNLTGARHVFHFDRWWNPAVEEQATDRAHRIGQTHTVQVHRLIVRGTLEERIDQLIASKAALARAVIPGAAEGWLTEMSTAALAELLALGGQALEVG